MMVVMVVVLNNANFVMLLVIRKSIISRRGITSF